MAAPGWYPDPESLTRERYWDGRAWTSDLRETGTRIRPATPPGAASEPFDPFQPSVPLPDLDDEETRVAARPPAAPPPQGPSTGGGWASGPVRPAYAPIQPPPAKRRTGLVVGVVVLLVALAGGVVAGVLTLGGDTATTADPDSTATPAPPTTTPPLLSNPCEAGRTTTQAGRAGDRVIRGGGLAFDKPRGFITDTDLTEILETRYGFSTDPQMMFSEIPGAKDYISTYAVMALDRSDFGPPETALPTVLECLATGSFYSEPEATYTAGDGVTTSSVDGRDAYSMRGEYAIPDEPIPGGDAEAILVDTDDPDTYGLFIGLQPLDDPAALEERADIVDSLRVD